MPKAIRYLSRHRSLIQVEKDITLYISKPENIKPTRYAAVVSSGNSPLEPRCAMLYGREVCKGRFGPLYSLLGSGFNGLAPQPTNSSSRLKAIIPVHWIVYPKKKSDINIHHVTLDDSWLGNISQYRCMNQDSLIRKNVRGNTNLKSVLAG